MSIANAVTLKPVRSVSTSVIKDDSVIVFSFSGGALPSGVTYSGPTNLYVPQSDGSYELVTSGPLFSDEALYVPAGFTDYIGNKTFAGAVAGNVQGSGSLPTGSSVSALDTNGNDTLTIIGVDPSDSDVGGLPTIEYRLQRGSTTGGGSIFLHFFSSAAAGRIVSAEDDTYCAGVKFRFTDLTNITGINYARLSLVARNSVGTGLETQYAQVDEDLSLQDLTTKITCPASTAYLDCFISISLLDDDLDITFKIAAPQLINKLTLPLCIANGSADSAIVVTGGSCTKASGVSLNPKLSVVLDYISQNGEVGQNDLINPSNARNFDISSSNGSTSLHAFTHNSTKHAVIEALAGSVYTSKLENDDVLMGGVTNRVVYVFGEEGIKISLNGGTTATETWEEYIDAGILTNIGYGCSAAGSLPAGIGVKTMTIYPNTEFSAAECQSRSAL